MRLDRLALFCALAATIFLQAESKAQINKVVALVKGNATTSSGNPATDVSITFFKGSERVNTTKSTTDGKFTQIAQPGTQYKVTFTGAKYYYHEEMLSVPQSDVYQIVPMNVVLKELELGRPYSFSSLIFEPKSSSISSSVMPDLEAIASAMKHNQKLTISATVYPDEAASGKKAAAQNSLAESRKSALLSFFLAKNIPSSNVIISTSGGVGTSGGFERTVTVEAAPTKGKKKKKAPVATSVKMRVPQDAEIIMQMGS